VAELIDRAAVGRYLRFARDYHLMYSCRPVGWQDLPAHLRSPVPGPQHFIGMMSRLRGGRPVALQWVMEQVRSRRSRAAISFPVALADLHYDVLALRTLKQDGVVHPAEDFTELARLETGLRCLLGEVGTEEFLSLPLA
jgi:hypothetical protein